MRPKLATRTLRCGVACALLASAPLAQAANFALIVTISRYIDPAVSPLPGTQIDRTSAQRIAQSMGVPPGNIETLRDQEATLPAIEGALTRIAARIQPGDRFFLYFSGHGTRYEAADHKGGCAEALFTAESGFLPSDRLSGLLRPISAKADKVIGFFDACFSGGLRVTRSLPGDLIPKVSEQHPQACSQAENVLTRGLLPDAQSMGATPNNVLLVAATRGNEVAFDDPERGGLATYNWIECALDPKTDADRSGTVSAEEIRACAQSRIDQRMARSTQYLPHHLTLSGNARLVPSLLERDPALPAPHPPAVGGSSAAPAQVAVAPLPPPSPTPVSLPSPPPPAATPAPVVPPPAAVHAFDPKQVLEDLFAQRDGRAELLLRSTRPSVKVGVDALSLQVRSRESGYLYLMLAGSDGKSLYLLYPNRYTKDNRVEAGRDLVLPGKGWKLVAQGPAGVDRILAVVTPRPVDLSAFEPNADDAIPALSTDYRNAGRILATLQAALQPRCQAGQRCGGYAAALISLEER